MSTSASKWDASYYDIPNYNLNTLKQKTIFVVYPFYVSKPMGNTEQKNHTSLKTLGPNQGREHYSHKIVKFP